MICGPRLTVLIICSSLGECPRKASDDYLGQDVGVPALDTKNRRKNSCLVATLWMLWIQCIIVQLLARDGRAIEIRQELQVSFRANSAFCSRSS